MLTITQLERLNGIDRLKEECWITKHPRWNSCCCQCVYKDKPLTKDFICFEDDVPDKDKHGMCEMFTLQP